MRSLLRSTALVLVGAAQVHADILITYDVTYSGASLGNSAVGTGTFTLDTSLINNPGFTSSPAVPFVTAFSLTISGASSGNGTFGIGDFEGAILDTDGGTLNFAEQLIGQPTAGDPFGTPDGNGGDFNFFSNPSDPSAPSAVAFFTIGTSGGSGDALQLTSVMPEATAVPEPSSLVLDSVALLGGLGALARRRHALNKLRLCLPG